jgi:glycerophosphoryl diester phosphodiesterase
MTKKTFAMLLLLLLPAALRADPQLIAHRGSCYFPPYNNEAKYPANTLEAFDAAIRDGFSGFELDVRLTRDGKAAVAHDDNVGIATNCKGKVGDYDLEALQKCQVTKSTLVPEVLAIKAKKSALLPSLAAVFGRFLPDSRVQTIVVDLKPAPTDQLLAALRDSLLGNLSACGKLIFISRDEAVLQGLQELCVPVGNFALEGNTGMEPLTDPGTYIPEGDGKARASHNVISLNLGLSGNDLFIDQLQSLATDAQRYDYRVLAWTISDALAFDFIRANLPGNWMVLTDLPYRYAKRYLSPRRGKKAKKATTATIPQ